MDIHTDGCSRAQYLYNAGALGVDNPLCAAGQPVDLAFGVPSSGNGGDLLNARNVLTAAEAERLPQIL